ncbi:MAG: TrkH family potassium uptake protein [Candidatus Bathyarchaeia archaeon]|jgi:trk system potassium uptake protein TrkH
MKKTITVLLANIGFVLQVSGVFILLPIVASFILGETDATIALFLTATCFLILGFFTNSFCEKKAMSSKQSSTLMVLVFVILGLIGSIPYLYLNVFTGDVFQRITDSLFESVSGFTTTGFSVIPDLSLLPKSIILYRALTQFIGGLGIVIVLLAFFYPEAKLRDFAKSMGLSKKNQKIRRTFFFIISLYCLCTAILVSAGYVFGYHDIINLSSIVFSAMSTGGFSPVNDIAPIITQSPMNLIIPIGMLLGATNFLIFASLYRKKFKEFLNSETIFFLIIIAIISGLVISYFSIPFYDASFHVISAMSSGGFSYLQIQNFSDSLKLLLISLMFIGGASLSTAGGIKIYRFLVLIKSFTKTVTFTIIGKENKMRLFGKNYSMVLFGKNDKLPLLGKNYSNGEVIQAGLMVLLTGALILVSSVIVCNYGFSNINALFECTSAIGNVGLSTGVAGPSLALELKWLFMVLMLVGRVEIMALFVIFARTIERRNGHKENKDSQPAETAESDGMAVSAFCELDKNNKTEDVE